ncbi:hypothetical protein A1O3_00310 [Capronia epimyces CBS 606.96]|uniref:Ubiquitin-like protease family profile domain-containing protein n=1 Tax=Capronia epimyces CBS 606.96 TaxID=1182542 RepID=W9YQ11_9EURO|nr:uncharacterized protein A1O3_00310 [Capronia epimyces CBS 606.96]EXJ91760.1 hypothetical protein A1O3_00310 [Capronia epimyces CBS 606.96]
MPPTPRRAYLTRNIPNYVQAHDSVPFDPIEIDSDEDDRSPPDGQSTRSSRRIQTQQTYSTPTQIRVKRSESRDEARLLPTLTKREPGSVTIPDPMKRSFTLKSGYKPMNTLDTARPGTRSHLVFEKTTNVRNPSYDNGQVHASKKRKLDYNHPNGSGATAAISSSDSQNQEESADELRLSPESTANTAAERDRYRRSSPRVYVSVPKSKGFGSVVGESISQLTASSPEDEGNFTKGSAKQRKAQKDRMLASSSPVSSSIVPAETVASPYFGAASTPSRHLRYKVLQHSSPDALQADQSPRLHTNFGESGRSLGDTDIKIPNALIVGNGYTATGNSRMKRANENIKSLKLDDVIYRRLPNASIYVVEIHCDTKEISINTEEEMLGGEPVVESRPISKIVEVKYGSDNSPLVSLSFSRQGHQEDKLYLKFQSHKAVDDFVKILKGCSAVLKMHSKPAEWMESAFAKAKTDHASHNLQKNHTAATPKEEGISATGVKPRLANLSAGKQIRHVDRLDPPHPISRVRTVISGAERNMQAATNDSVSRIRKQVSPENISPEQPQMLTRSRDTKQTSSEDAQSDGHPRPRPSEYAALEAPWRRDLIYPGPGKKSATVPFEDLRRLDDDEFLNDNLISFFMQYLETFMEKNNPELYREMYFFNTYFYEALTKNVKGKKGINYDAVSRWTKNINIFKRKFVVVPVNENFHWYLAIICNMSYFLPKAEDDGAGEEQADQSLQNPEGSPVSDRQSEGLENVATPATEDTQKSLAELSITDDEEKNGANKSKGQLKRGPGRRRVIRRSLPKYDIEKPVIITLDSLGSSRSATCSLLRQYIVAEAKNKQDLDIDATELRGMTAKQIPTQSNFSDCGLYLCMYLEQFVADPFHFVSRILQREEEAQRWPRTIRSEDLRSRLRELILELHRRQETHTSTVELPNVGSIMVEKREPSLEPPAVPEPVKHRTKQDIAEAKLRYDGIAIARRNAHQEAPPQEDDSTSRLRTTPTCKKHAYLAEDSFSHARDNDDDPIMISREEAPRRQVGDVVRVGDHFRYHKPIPGTEVLVIPFPGQGVDTVGDQCFAHSTPAELARSLRQKNELREAKRKRSRSGDEGDSGRRERARSVSTEFLSGLESYAVNHHSPRVERAEDVDSTKLRSSPRSKGAMREEVIDHDDAQYEWQRAAKRRRPQASPFDGSRQARWAHTDDGGEVPENQEGNNRTMGVRGRVRDMDENNEMLLR